MKNIYFSLRLHIVCGDTHGDSVCGRPGRSREGRMPGIGGCLGPAGSDGSHRTGNPICWNRWHRMTGRLQDEEEKGGRDPGRQSFEILISVLVSLLSLWLQDILSQLHWIAAQAHSHSGWVFLTSSCADWDGGGGGCECRGNFIDCNYFK